MLSPLEKSILATVSYFDIFDYPLTSFEIYKYLLSPAGQALNITYFEVKKTLDGFSPLQKKIQTCEGFYFLFGREGIISIRKERYIIAREKFKQAKRFIKFLSKLPFINAIYICNSLSYSNARPESDIDLAIICRPKTIWLVRMLAAGLTDFLRKRPAEDNLTNKICLSFYACTDNLSIEKYQSECPDVHFIFWQSQFLPIYEKDEKTFFNENTWAKKYLPNQIYQSANQSRAIQHQSKIKKRCENLLCKTFIKYINKKAKKYQLKIMPAKLKVAAQEPNTNVVLDDDIIKLHSNDKRQEYNQKWRIKYKSILNFYENNQENN